jgi:cation diffusion facilitator family transporter
MSDHDHNHDDGPTHASVWARVRHFLVHDHDHDHDPRPIIDSGAEGIRATKISLLGLGATAVLQAVLVLVTGSVALLSDTLHNFTDALTAIPLWIAFSLGRRPATRRFTYGYHRAEDLAGVIIVLAIGFSAAAIAWESLGRIASPRELDYIPLVVAAGFIGALGNEWVARYRLRVGRRIGSDALVTDGYHARADALTSLAVVAAGIGAMVGAAWVDPVAGLAVAVMILSLLWRSARNMFGRLLDAVEPEIVERIEHTARHTPGVEAVTGVQARHQGHRLLVTMSVSVDPEATVATGHAIAQEVKHNLMHEFTTIVEPLIHVDPHGEHAAHESTAHHS